MQILSPFKMFVVSWAILAYVAMQILLLFKVFVLAWAIPALVAMHDNAYRSSVIQTGWLAVFHMMTRKK